MPKTSVERRLEALGFSAKEAITYPALLKLEAATVRELTAETGLNRSSLYVVLDRLIKQGLVSISDEKGVRKYVPAPPERLTQSIKEQSERYLLLRQNLATFMPTLINTHRVRRHKPRIFVLEGVEGLRKAFEYTLNNKEKLMRVFSRGNDISSSLPNYLPKYIETRVRRGIRMIGIHPEDEYARKVLHELPNLPIIDDLTYINPERFSFPSDIAVFDNFIGIMLHQPPLAIGIQSSEMAKAVKVLFNLAHTAAKRYDTGFVKDNLPPR